MHMYILSYFLVFSEEEVPKKAKNTVRIDECFDAFGLIGPASEIIQLA